MPRKEARDAGAPLLALSPTDFESTIFPAAHHLVVATHKHVYSWAEHDVTTLFTSGSAGIVAAREARDGSGQLAVADSHVVILHDFKKKQERSYRLKKTDGQMRLLEYANESSCLFFTTSLQNAVQSYSLQQSKLLDPSHVHASPPTCIAVSPTSHLLVSASAFPPTIYLQNLTLRTRPISLRPRASAAPVAAVNFHPERVNVFLLAFTDGTLAAYNATRLLGRAGRDTFASGCGQGGEVGYLRKVHTATLSGMTAKDAGASGLEPNEQSKNGADSIGAADVSNTIVAAQFLPGYIARVVSVGTDGKAAMIDFENLQKGKGRLIRSWHIRGPATSLAILPYHRDPNLVQSDAGPEGEKKQSLIAIGRVDGKVLLFNTTGTLLGEKTFDLEGGRIIDVEWVPGGSGGDSRSVQEQRSAASRKKSSSNDTQAPRSASKKSVVVGRAVVRQKPGGRSKRKSLGSIMAAGREAEEDIFVIPDGADEGSARSTALETAAKETLEKSESTESYRTAPEGRVSSWQDVAGSYDEGNYMNLFSPVKQKPRKRRSSRLAVVTTLSDTLREEEDDEEEQLARGINNARNVVSAPQLWPQRKASTSEKLRTRLSPRPSLTKVRRISIRRHSRLRDEHAPGDPPAANGSSSAKNASTDSSAAAALAELQSASNRRGPPKSSGRALSLFAPYMQHRDLVKSSAHDLTSRRSSSLTHRQQQQQQPPQPGKGTDENGDVDDIWVAEGGAHARNDEPSPRRAPSRDPSGSTASTTTTTTGPRSAKNVSFGQAAPAAFEILDETHPRLTSSLALPVEGPSSAARMMEAEMAALHADMLAFRTEMLGQFGEQRRFFEDRLREERERSEGLRGVVEGLRREVEGLRL